jgi:hypothetical protein
MIQTARYVTGELKDHSEGFKRPEIDLSTDLKGKDRTDLLARRKQDSVLFSNVRGSIIVNSHEVFAKNYNHFPDIVYSKINVYRSYWLGNILSKKQPIFETQQEGDQYVSDALIDDLVQFAVNYKINFNRVPASQILDLKQRNSLPNPEFYREWFKRHFGKSTYTSKIIPLLAERKSLAEILEVIPTGPIPVFGGLFHAPIIFREEVEKILDILATNPESRELNAKNTLLKDISESIQVDTQSDRVAKLEQELKEAMNLINQLTKKIPNKTTKETE